MKPIDYLRIYYPEAEVFESVDKDFLVVRETLCKDTKIDGVIVPLTKTTKFHVDTVRVLTYVKMKNIQL